tara:strand:- start:618 stop:923 length:306 start_codon:yes stop_codon:yes gene_type:complete
MTNDVKFPKTSLDKDLTNLTNNELANYLTSVTDDVYTALKTNKLSLMNILIGYKIRIERKLEDRLKKKTESIKSAGGSNTMRDIVSDEQLIEIQKFVDNEK